MAGTGRSLYQVGFQNSPIILTQGLATAVPGGMLPIIVLTQGIDFLTGILTSGNPNLNLDQFFAQFEPAPGTTLINNDVATYPFANQTVAANSMIAQPLRISMIMTCPARPDAGFYSKLATMSAVQTALAAHNAAGGTYSIVTPSKVYTSCIMLNMVDVSGSNTKQRQVSWQLEFMQPLITESQAKSVQSHLMSILSNQTQPNGALAWSGQGIASSATSSTMSAAGLPIGTGG